MTVFTLLLGSVWADSMLYVASGAVPLVSIFVSLPTTTWTEMRTQ